MSSLIDKDNPDAGRKFIQSLAANYGLVVRALPSEQLLVSPGIKPPGTFDAEPVTVSLSAAMPKDKITAWMIENEGDKSVFAFEFQVCKSPLIGPV